MIKTKLTAQLASYAVVLSLLSGCFLYLPHHKMKITNRTDTVPFSVFGGGGTVNLYCQRTDNSINLWQQFGSVALEGAIADKKKNVIATGHSLQAVPAACWTPLTNSNASKNFATLIRIGADGNWGTVSKSGLRCLGEKFGIGKLAGYQDCGRFDSSNQPVDVVKIFSKN